MGGELQSMEKNRIESAKYFLLNIFDIVRQEGADVSNIQKRIKMINPG